MRAANSRSLVIGILVGTVVAFVVSSFIRVAADYDAWSLQDYAVKVGLAVVFNLLFIRVFSRWFG